jgi:hypothetical protein
VAKDLPRRAVLIHEGEPPARTLQAPPLSATFARFFAVWSWSCPTRCAFVDEVGDSDPLLHGGPFGHSAEHRTRRAVRLRPGLRPGKATSVRVL